MMTSLVHTAELKLQADQERAKAQYDYAVYLSSHGGGPDDWADAARYFKLSAD
jgi:hypothetical protein